MVKILRSIFEKAMLDVMYDIELYRKVIKMESDIQDIKKTIEDIKKDLEYIHNRMRSVSFPSEPIK